MKETGWKKTAGNGSDGKRTEGKKSFGRGEKATGFSKNSAKVGVNGEKQGKAARKVSGVEDKWGTHGDRKRNVGGGINLFPAVHFQCFLLEFHFIVAVSFLQFFNLRLDFFHLGHAVV